MNNNKILNKVNSNNIKKFKETYFVNDLIGKNAKIVFVLESPHSDEIICKYPAAGNTGIAMSKKLRKFTDKTTLPLGKYIFNNLDNSIFGIMNCCQIPMQPSPYCYKKDFDEMLTSFKTIRKTKVNVERRSNPKVQSWDDAILNDFQQRINNIPELNNKIITPCGKMAEYFLIRCNCQVNIVSGIPHPAYNNWSKKKDQIKIMINKIKEFTNGKDN